MSTQTPFRWNSSGGDDLFGDELNLAVRDVAIQDRQTGIVNVNPGTSTWTTFGIGLSVPFKLLATGSARLDANFQCYSSQSTACFSIGAVLTNSELNYGGSVQVILGRIIFDNGARQSGFAGTYLVTNLPQGFWLATLNVIQISGTASAFLIDAGRPINFIVSGCGHV